MKKSVFVFVIFVIGLLAFSEANAQTFSLSVGNGKVRKGRTARGFIVMNIPKGLHVNSYRPKSEYAVPTRVTVRAPGANAGSVRYPPGKVLRFAFSDEPISVYVGRVVFGFNLRVPKGYRGRTVKVKATIRYQACTNEVCYAPKSKTLTLNVRVR